MAAEPLNLNYVYDFDGRLTSTTDRGARTMTHYDRYGRVIDPAAPPLPPPAEPLPPDEPIVRLFTHTFEFRLLGAEVQLLGIELPLIPPNDRIVVTTDHVRTFVTRSGEPAAPSNLIGGVEVSTEQLPMAANHNGRLVCTAQATEFAPGDLVVVGVEVTLFWVMLSNQSSRVNDREDLTTEAPRHRGNATQRSDNKREEVSR
jgi:hypothetical protein